MAVNRSFGDAGIAWSAVPRDLSRYSSTYDPDQRYLGGRATGMVVDATGPLLTCWGWSPQRFTEKGEVGIIAMPADGASAAEFTWPGTTYTRISDDGQYAVPLASCAGPGAVSVLLLQLDPNSNTFRLDLCELQRAQIGVSVQGRRLVPSAAVFLPEPYFSARAVRMTWTGTQYLVVSSRQDRVRVSVVGANTKVAPDIVVGGPGTAAPGVVAVDVVSVVFDGTWVTLGLTVHEALPGIGGVERPAVLRVTAAGLPDLAFGERGLWVAPVTVLLRHVGCAGASLSGGRPSHVVGVQGRDLIAVAIGSGGDGVGDGILDPFGLAGVLQFGLGGTDVLHDPVAVDDGQWTYLVAGAGARLVCCRFDRQGTVDAAFGRAGIARIPDDPPAAMVADEIGTSLIGYAAQLGNGRLYLSTEWAVQGVDCADLPAVAVIDAATGGLDTGFGAAGFALQDAIGGPAVVCPDGSAVFTERLGILSEAIVLVRTTTTGRRRHRFVLSPNGVDPAELTSLYAMDDGSVLAAGGGSAGWVVKILPDDSLDPAFGTAGTATPRSAATSVVVVLGVLGDGRVGIQVDYEVAFLTPAGGLDPGYAVASGGFVGLVGFTEISTPTAPSGSGWARPFLQPDGSVICAMNSSRQYTYSPSLRTGLRRIDAAGDIDPGFGLGVVDVNPPPAGTSVTFADVTGNNRLGYSSIETVGFQPLGGTHYQVIAGIAGNLRSTTGGVPSPPYEVIAVIRWNADGTVDPGFSAIGRQEVGLSPELTHYRAFGVLPLDGTQAVIVGTAGRADQEVHSVGNQQYTVTVLRRPEPALFRITHPLGIVLTAAGEAATERMQMQEFAAVPIAARVLPPLPGSKSLGRVRFVCADERTQGAVYTSPPTSNFGGLGEFVMLRPPPRPPRPIRP